MLRPADDTSVHLLVAGGHHRQVEPCQRDCPAVDRVELEHRRHRCDELPGVVDHGVSGVVVNDAEEFVAAVPAVLELDPVDCRAVALARFDLPVMAAGYEKVYRRIVGRPQHRDALGATA